MNVVVDPFDKIITIFARNQVWKRSVAIFTLLPFIFHTLFLNSILFSANWAGEGGEGVVPGVGGGRGVGHGVGAGVKGSAVRGDVVSCVGSNVGEAVIPCVGGAPGLGLGVGAGVSRSSLTPT